MAASSAERHLVGHPGVGGADRDEEHVEVAHLGVRQPGVVTSTVHPSVFGQPVTFTATLTGAQGTPTGSIQFGVDGGNLGSPVALTGGVATSTAVATLGVGSHNVTATYGGDVVYRPGGSGLTHVVNKAGTTTTVTSSANPSAFGPSVHFTAAVAPVAPGAGLPSGAVQFLVDGSNLGGPVTLVAGVADSIAVSSLGVGPHPVTATYAGDAGFNAGSGSLAAPGQVVQKSDTSTTVSSSQNPSVFGQAVQFTAQVAPAGNGAGTPDGTVQFVVDGSSFGAPVTLSGGSAT
ncbi:MAG: large repetitive protein, partial [Actinomycetota bacterium]|nr:large repetitive protein [Actinomycetota bacterium]